MRIAVTGASGFIGGAVATALADAGHTVTGFGRRPDGWRHPLGDYRVWDLTDAEVPSGVDAADAVVHAAALADDWADPVDAMRVNRDGTRAVVAAFPERRIVHLSTSSVYAANVPTVMAREDAGPAPHPTSVYARTKALAESELGASDAVILRPHAVYGPGDTTLLPRVAAAVRRGRLALPAGGSVRHSLTRIDNLVRAVVRGLDSGVSRGIYNVADAEPVMLDAVLAEFLERRAVEARIVAVPYRVALTAAGLAESAARLTRRRPRMTRYAVAQLGRERTLDLTAARTQLGYDPAPTDLDGAETW